MAIDFNPYDPAYRADPHPTWRALRTQEPVHRSSLGAWVVTRHDDVAALSRSPVAGAARPGLDRLGLGPDAPLSRVYDHVMLFLDPPHHTRLRRLVQLAFTPARIERLRATTETRMAELLDRVRRRPAFDVVGDVGRRLSVQVISDLLGLPAEDGMRVWAWTRELAGAFDLLSATPRQLESWNRVILAFRRWLEPIVDARRREPRDDLISAMVQATAAGDRLSADELLTTCVFLFSAGHETTTFAIANAIHLAAQRPGTWEALRASPTLVPAYLDEVLRFECPVQFSARRLEAPLELRGVTLAAGDRVILGYGAACRDPERYHDPEELRIERTGQGHLAFGHGPHFCLGAKMAQLEGGVAIDVLLREPGFRVLAYSPEWVPDVSLRGLVRLPATLRGPRVEGGRLA
jgi:cytochrome P450